MLGYLSWATLSTSTRRYSSSRSRGIDFSSSGPSALSIARSTQSSLGRGWCRRSTVAPVLPAGRACMAGAVRVPQYRRRAFVIVLLTLWIMCRALACPCRSLLLVNSA
jgi:hypothetical protein